MSSFNDRKAKVLTHPSQLAHRELPQSVASEGEGEDPGVLEGRRQVSHGHIGALNGPEVVTCRTRWLHGWWRRAMRPLSQVQVSGAKSGDKWMRRRGDGLRWGRSHFYPRSHEAEVHPSDILCSKCEVAPHHSTPIFATAGNAGQRESSN